MQRPILVADRKAAVRAIGEQEVRHEP
jgi:hypothetical protein